MKNKFDHRDFFIEYSETFANRLRNLYNERLESKFSTNEDNFLYEIKIAEPKTPIANIKRYFNSKLHAVPVVQIFDQSKKDDIELIISELNLEELKHDLLS